MVHFITLQILIERPSYHKSSASAMMTPVPPFLVAVPYLIYKRCTRRAKTVDDMIDDEIKIAKNGDIADTKKAKQVPSLADKKRKEWYRRTEANDFRRKSHFSVMKRNSVLNVVKSLFHEWIFRI